MYVGIQTMFHLIYLLFIVPNLFQMEFSYGTKKWTPRDELGDAQLSNVDGFALGLHAPGRFDKILSINKCLLQQDSANKVHYLMFHRLKIFMHVLVYGR